MPRYFFDLELDDGIPTTDEEGLMLADVRAAKVEAARSISDVAKGMIEGDQPLTTLTVTVQTADGPIMTAAFSLQMATVN